MNGFTLIELLTVISLTLIIGLFTFPISLSYYQRNVLNEVTNEIKNTVQLAHTQSVFQKNDSAHGVKILADSFILFEGDTYAVRDPNKDRIFFIPNSVAVSGLDEVIFSQYTGIPNATGTITAILNSETSAVTIEISGLVK